MAQPQAGKRFAVRGTLRRQEPTMNERSNCHCPICELEQTLLDEIGDEKNSQQYRDFASQSSILSGFPTAIALLRRVRETAKEDNQMDSHDDILGQLLHLDAHNSQNLRHRLLLLILMPAVHKTSRQIAAGFPSLARDDIAQHLLTAVLEILRSKTLLRKRSHFAFTITRLMRRHSFRWALRETRLTPNADLGPLADVELAAEADTTFETDALLREFLRGCISRGLLTEAEYELLMLFKIQGVPSEVLAAREGLSEIAFRHRMQWVIDRLRRIAQP